VNGCECGDWCLMCAARVAMRIEVEGALSNVAAHVGDGGDVLPEWRELVELRFRALLDWAPVEAQ